MRKLLSLFLLSLTALFLRGQYAVLNADLDRLEAKNGINNNVSKVSLEDRQFVLIKDHGDTLERNFLIIKGSAVTLVQVSEIKKTAETSSKVYTGDILRTENQIISFRGDRFEGNKIPVPLTKTFLLAQQKQILYLIDINSKERWIEERALRKK